MFYMDIKIMSLDKLPLGSLGRVKQVLSDSISRRRLLDLGLISGTRVRPIMKSPKSDPVAYEIRGALIALRSEEAKKVLIERI